MYDTNTVFTSSNLSTTDATTLFGGLAAASGAFILIMIVVALVCALISYAVSSFLISRIFKKAGVKTSIAWIPIYNAWKMLELGDQKGFWVLFSLFPPLAIVSIVFTYIAMYHIGKKLGKEDWFVVIAILAAPVWFIWLGFDKSVWNGAKPEVATDPTATPVAPAAPEPINVAPVATPTPAVAPEQPVYTAPEAPAPVEAETPITPEIVEAPAPTEQATEPTDTTENTVE